MPVGTNTHYVTRPGYEGACCENCAAAVGGYRALEESSVDFGQPCWSCEEMVRDADHEAWERESTQALLDSRADGWRP